MSEDVDIQQGRSALLPGVRDKLSSGMLSDATDGVGCRGQVLVPCGRPLDEWLRLSERACAEWYVEVDNAEAGENPNEFEIAIDDNLKARDVAVFARNGFSNMAPWVALSGQRLTPPAPRVAL